MKWTRWTCDWSGCKKHVDARDEKGQRVESRDQGPTEWGNVWGDLQGFAPRSSKAIGLEWVSVTLCPKHWRDFSAKLVKTIDSVAFLGHVVAPGDRLDEKKTK